MQVQPVPLLDRLRPMFPAKGDEPFDSTDWLFELKWDGVRALAFIDGDKVVLRGQNGSEITGAYLELQGLPAQLKGDNAVLDGDIVALGKAGHPDMELLRPRLNDLLQGQPQGPYGPITYQVSDILALDGRLLTDLPLWERKNVLHSHFEPSGFAQVAEFVDSEGVAFFDAVCEQNLAGMVAKRKQSIYQPGRKSNDWLEIQSLDVGHFVIGGYTFGGGQKKEAFQALLLGAYDDEGALQYVGRATAGLSTPEAWRTVQMLEGLYTADCPFADPPSLNRLSYWCEPKLVCQVRLGERTRSGEFRFVIFVSLRPDMSPLECRIEQDDDAPENEA